MCKKFIGEVLIRENEEGGWRDWERGQTWMQVWLKKREDGKEMEAYGVCANLLMAFRAQYQGPAVGDLRGAFPLAAQPVVEGDMLDYAHPLQGQWD